MDIWDIEESRLKLNGRCYTLKTPYNVAARNFSTRFVLAKNISYNINLHSRNQHIFLDSGIDPFKMSYLENFPGSDNIYFADIRLETIRKTLRQENYRCQDISMDEYFECAIQIMKDTAKSYCRTPFTATLVGKDEEYLKSMARCNTSEEMNHAVYNMSATLIRVATSKYEGNITCHKPCTRVHYDATTKIVHGSPPEFNSSGIPIYVYFSDLSERIEQDVLVYNTADLVSAIGGSLGILLGISLLSLTSKGLKLLYR